MASWFVALCGVGLLSCVLAETSSDDSGGAQQKPSAVGGGQEALVKSIDDKDGIFNTYIGYVMGSMSMDEKEALVHAFCDATNIQESGFKCDKKLKSALVGSFEEGKTQNLERLREAAKQMGYCQKASSCELHIYQAQRTEMDNDWMGTQLHPHWGLDRIDQEDLPLDQKFQYATTGKGVTIFIMDTGVQKQHDEFKKMYSPGESRALHGFSSFSYDNLEESSSDDCVGHGTQVASLAAGTTYGVAKDAAVVAVQVLPCNGTGSSVDLMIGLQWVLDNVDFYRPAVALLSLHVHGIDAGIEDTIERLTEAGVLVVTSAGNGGIDACKFSPGRMDSTLTVGASNFFSQVVPNSNTGPCVDIYAPGVNLLAGSVTSKEGYEFVTGTSFAAGLAAGAVAQLLERNPRLTPPQIIELLSETHAAKGKLTHESKEGDFPLLQVDLSQPGTEKLPPRVEPGLAVHPRNLHPVNLFKDTKSQTDVITIQITNYGSNDLEWSASTIGANGRHPRWVDIIPSSGLVKSEQRMSVNITYSAQRDAPGFYQAFVEITSNDPHLELIQLPLEARIFCTRLYSAGQSYTATLNQTVYYPERPDSWPPAQLPDNDDTFFIESVLVLSQPIVRVDEVDLQVPGGLIETFTPVDDELCSMYHVRAIKSRENVWDGSNNFCIHIWENTIFSISGKTFSNQTVCADYDDEPESRIYATHMSFDPDRGLITDSSNPVMVVAFSEEVQGFEERKIEVSPGILESLKPVPGSASMFYVHIRLPEDYIGTSTLRVNVDGVKDLTGNAVVDAPSLSFQRVHTMQMDHTSFEVKSEL